MSDTSILPAQDEAADDASVAAARRMFYVVSRRKLAILFIATFGLYAIYWFYKNWSQYKNHASWTPETRPSIWPGPRSLFVIFFIHSLFRKVKAYGSDKPQVAAWNNNILATIMVVLYIGTEIADRASRHMPSTPFFDLLSFLGTVALLLCFLKAQSMINASCGDPRGAANDELTGANYAWIIVGGLFWLLILGGGFIRGASEGYAPSSPGSF